MCGGCIKACEVQTRLLSPDDIAKLAAQLAPKLDFWVCDSCGFQNAAAATKCKECNQPKEKKVKRKPFMCQSWYVYCAVLRNVRSQIFYVTFACLL